MKTLRIIGQTIHIVFIFFITSTSIQSQTKWFWLHPLPTGNLLSSVHFTDGNIGNAAGTLGTIIKTTDGGINWAIQNSNTTNDLAEILFTNSFYGVAVGRFGTILKTINGGNNWLIQSSNTNNYLYDVVLPLIMLNMLLDSAVQS